jgi:hypothetical protein
MLGNDVHLSLKDCSDIPFPPKEDCSNITAQQIVEKINAFYERFENNQTEIGDFAEGYFMQLLAAYPCSMCNYNMSDELSLVVALIYFHSKVKDGVCDDWEGYTYDDLALVFDRSKQTIFSAIKHNEQKANEILREYKWRCEARQKVEKQLLEEERLKRLNIHIIKQPNKQTVLTSGEEVYTGES